MSSPQREIPAARSRRTGEWTARLVMLALALAYLVTGALWSRGVDRPLGPDATDYAVAGRSLAEGQGYTVGFRAYHVGLRDRISHTPEAHGILRPFALAPLFATLGFHDWVVPLPGFLYVSLCSIVAFLWAGSLAGPGAGLVAGVLTLSSGPLFESAARGYDDIGFACFSVASLALLHRGIVARSPLAFLLSGVVAVFALLEKLSGLVLAPVALLSALLWLRREPALALRCAAAWVLPFPLGCAAYVARSFAANGHWTPQLGPMEWMWKLGAFEGLFAIFPAAPTWSDLYAQLGLGGMLGIAADQLRVLAESSVTWSPWYIGDGLAGPPWLFLAGAFGAVALIRSPLGTIASLTWLATLALVDGLYHNEPRYFNGLVPLTAITIAVGLTRLASFRSPRAPRATPVLRIAVPLVAITVCAWSLLAGVESWLVLDAGAGARLGPTCADSYRWLRQNTSPDEAVLSFAPSSVAWYAQRPSLMIPSGGVSAIDRVASHYGARWLLIQQSVYRQQTERAVREMVERDIARPVFTGRRCRVARLAG